MSWRDKKRVIIVTTLLFLLITIGTVGYMTLINVSFVDALYMTIITISTVGYGEVGKMTEDAKIFSIFIIFGGITIVGYALGNLISIFVEGILNQAWKVKRMENKIEKLENHYIICGAGQTGKNVIKSFKEAGKSFVVIEKCEERYRELLDEDLLVIHGDSTHEEVLEKAKIYQSIGLVSTVSTDADNLFIVLTAREMKQDLYIVSRAIEERSDYKLKKAGADATVSPNDIGGHRMAALAIKPQVISFLDTITSASDIVLDLENVIISTGSIMEGRELRDLRIPEATGLIILAIKKKNCERFKFNPNSSEVLGLHDTLIVLGTEEQIDKLRSMACDTGRVSEKE